MDKQTKVLIIIPTYNEAQLIGELVCEILRLNPEFDILIIDDNSPDGTGVLADDLAKSSDRIKVIHRLKKSGLGKAYIAGFKYALSSKPAYTEIIQMDADFSHNPKYLNNLLEAARSNGVALGSRYIQGGISDWSLSRKLLSYMANLYVRFWLGLKVKDCTGGFRCFSREVLSNIGVETIMSKGYLFQIEVLFRCLRLGYQVKEIPITFIERKKGKTKLGFNEVVEAIFGVLQLRFFSFRDIRRAKMVERIK